MAKDRFSTFNHLVDEEAAKQRDLAKRQATGRPITVAAYELTNFVTGKLVALNGAVVERIEKRSDDQFMIFFETYAREAIGEYQLYELP